MASPFSPSITVKVNRGEDTTQGTGYTDGGGAEKPVTGDRRPPRDGREQKAITTLRQRG